MAGTGPLPEAVLLSETYCCGRAFGWDGTARMALLGQGNWLGPACWDRTVRAGQLAGTRLLGQGNWLGLDCWDWTLG